MSARWQYCSARGGLGPPHRPTDSGVAAAAVHITAGASDRAGRDPDPCGVRWHACRQAGNDTALALPRRGQACIHPARLRAAAIATPLAGPPAGGMNASPCVAGDKEQGGPSPRFPSGLEPAYMLVRESGVAAAALHITAGAPATRARDPDPCGLRWHACRQAGNDTALPLPGRRTPASRAARRPHAPGIRTHVDCGGTPAARQATTPLSLSPPGAGLHPPRPPPRRCHRDAARRPAGRRDERVAMQSL